jgi:hypothetical protein
MTATTIERRQHTDAGRPVDSTRLRLGAGAMVVGLLGQVPLGTLHPHQEYANDSAAAFHEYAHSEDWVLVHLGQYVGVLLVAIGLVAVATSLARQRGPAGFLGVVAAVTAVTSTAVFAVQMAVDGVALKAAVDAWVSATGSAERDAAYLVAESVRSVEKGLSALFNVTNGVTMLSLGVGLALTGRSRWLGWIAAVAGLGLVAVGVITARTGFSHEATALMLPTTAAVAVFAIGMALTAWRRTDSGPSSAPAA